MNTLHLAPACSCGSTQTNTPIVGSPNKAVPHAWLCSSSPKERHHHFKLTSALGREEDNHIYQFDCGLKSGQGVEIWFDFRPHSSKKASQGTTQEEGPAVLCDHSSWEMLSVTQFKPKAVPEWPISNTGNKSCPNRQRESLQMTELKANVSHPQQEGIKHTGNTPEVSGFGEKGTLHCMALQNLLFMRSPFFKSKSYS